MTGIGLPNGRLGKSVAFDDVSDLLPGDSFGGAMSREPGFFDRDERLSKAMDRLASQLD